MILAGKQENSVVSFVSGLNFCPGKKETLGSTRDARMERRGTTTYRTISLRNHIPLLQ